MINTLHKQSNRTKNKRQKQISEKYVFVTNEDNPGRGKRLKKHNKRYDIYTSLPKGFIATSCDLDSNEPKNFKTAILTTEWRKVMDEEYNTLIENNIWD